MKKLLNPWALLFLGALSFFGKAEAQTTFAKRLTITLYTKASATDTTALFSFPAVAGLAEISPSTTSQNPPDQSWWNGAHALVVTQTSGDLCDSLEIKIKPLDYDGTVIDNDSLVVGSKTVAASGNIVKILNKPHVFTLTGSFDPCFGISAAFTVGDISTTLKTRTFTVEHVTNGSYHVKGN